MLGGYGVLGSGAAVEKTFEMLSAHTQVRVTFNFIKIDSWDPGENAFLYIDNVLVWQSGDFYMTGTGECGDLFSGRGDALVYVNVAVAHTADTATLRVTTNLNQAASDESWGIQDVHVLLIE